MPKQGRDENQSRTYTLICAYHDSDDNCREVKIEDQSQQRKRYAYSHCRRYRVEYVVSHSLKDFPASKDGFNDDTQSW